MNPSLPRNLARNPRLGLWVRFLPGELVEIRTGKVELGQGITSALAQIAAEELDVSYGRIRMVAADTVSAPDEGVTAGSKSIADSGAALRMACAEVRALFLRQAARDLETDVETIEVRDGLFVHVGTNQSLSYWEMADRVSLDREASGRIAVKAPAASRLTGKPLPRLDIPEKIDGGAFIHDLDLPHMLYGRVARPPSYAASLVDVDLDAVRALPGVVATVRRGRFLGVVAIREEQAVAAATALSRKAIWEEPPSLPDVDTIADFLPTQTVRDHVLRDTRGTSAPAPDAPEGLNRLEAQYFRPFLAHGSIGPSCALAHWEDGDRLAVWTHSQSIHLLRKDIARVVGVDPVVRHVPGAGAYGHNSADDAAMDAVLLAQAVPGRPVKLQWSREDEFAWAPYGPAMLARLAATVAADGTVTEWTHELWSNPHIMRPGLHETPSLLAAWHLDEGFEMPNGIDTLGVETGASSRNAVPMYNFARQKIVLHELRRLPLRTSTLRAIGAFLNVFALESFVDELAASIGEDPAGFRLRHLDDPRARAVISAAVKALRSPGAGEATGLAFARYNNEGAYAAVAMSIEAGEEIRVRRVVAAVDCGRVVNSDGVANQIEGGIVQALSWTLMEQLRFDNTRITTRSWQDYPILRFSQVPPVECVLIDRPDEPSLGVGEAVAGPAAAALANAVFNALGVRVRDLPLTRAQILKAMQDTD